MHNASLNAAKLEEALRQELAGIAAGGIDVDAKRRLGMGLAKAPDPRKTFAATEKALVERKARVLFMFERGDIDQAGYTERLAKINLELQAAREQLKNAPKADLAWCEAQVGNLMAAWDKRRPGPAWPDARGDSREPRGGPGGRPDLADLRAQAAFHGVLRARAGAGHREDRQVPGGMGEPFAQGTSHGQIHPRVKSAGQRGSGD